jgi:prepilin-type N-terminal cleavage/methylation domain-containing protein
MVIKKAFSMIELVISIVIIGIVAASFPLILTQTSNNVAFAMQQEAILTAKTYMGTILSYTWDTSSIVPTPGNNKKVVVLSTNNANFENTTSNSTLRKGHIDQPTRRQMYIDNTTDKPTRVIIGMPTDPFGIDRSVNDYEGRSENLTVVTADNDSIININLLSNLYYVSDTAAYANTDIILNFQDENGAGVGRGVAPTNIKLITVNAASPGLQGLAVILRAYTSNIGELELYWRDY